MTPLFSQIYKVYFKFQRNLYLYFNILLRHEQQKTQLLLENENLKKRVKQLIGESEDIAGNRLMLIGKTIFYLY